MNGTDTQNKPCYPHFAPGEHRHLLADIHEWMRSVGCTNRSRGWIDQQSIEDARVAVLPKTEQGTVQVQWRTGNGGWHQPEQYGALDAGQAVDLLVALNILPANYSSQWRDGFNAGRTFAADAKGDPR